MSSSASTFQPVQSTSATVEHAKDDDVPHLGVLEEDDEFEEFAVAGTFRSYPSCVWVASSALFVPLLRQDSSFARPVQC